ncbi:MAG: class I SAM-dependent methyltransferase [Streptosporangiaceae bacterium]
MALDAACGTGRFAEFLARRGHRVIGVDSSPDMLAYARRRVPEGEFRLGELDRLPLPDESVDVIVCALALVHVPRLEPVLAEFVRVLRPAGDLVISDIHHELVTRGSVITARAPAGEPWIAATCRHQLGDYLRSALSLGLQVRRCEEPRAVPPASRPPEPATEIGDWQRLAMVAGRLPAIGRTCCWRAPAPGHLALPAKSMIVGQIGSGSHAWPVAPHCVSIVAAATLARRSSRCQPVPSVP